MAEVKLKECPFCGCGEASIYFVKEPSGSSWRYAQCNECYACYEISDEKEIRNDQF